MGEVRLEKFGSPAKSIDWPLFPSRDWGYACGPPYCKLHYEYHNSTGTILGNACLLTYFLHDPMQIDVMQSMDLHHKAYGK